MADKTIPALKILRGKVGINTATPDSNHNLTISNTANYGIRFTGTNATIQSNLNLIETAGNNIYLRPGSGYEVYIDSGDGLYVTSGSVGIGTNAPGAKIDVNGSAIFRGAAGWAGNDNQACAIYLNTAGRGVMGNFSNYARNLVKANSNYVEVGQNSTLVYGIKFRVGSNAPNGFMFESNIGGTMTTHMSIRGDTGRVGIGTNAPGDVLHVDGNTIIGDTDRQSVVLTLKAQNTAGAPAATTKLVMKGYEGRGIGTFYEDSSYSGQEWFCGMNYSAAFGTWNVGYDASGGQAEYNANTLFRVRYTGRVEMLNYGSGTFTGTPTYKLAVDSNGNIIETAIGAGQVDGSGTANYISKWTDGDTLGNASIYDNGSNRISLGTINTSPWQALDVRSTGSQFSDGAGGNQNYNITVVDQNAYTANYAGGILFGGKYNSSGAVTTLAMVSASKVSGNGNHGGKVHVGGRENGTATVPKVLTVTHANVGIGQVDPKADLHIGSSFSDAANDLATAALGIKQSGASPANGIYLERSGERKGYYIGILSSASDGLTFMRNFSGTKSEVMVLTRDGNVGINTTSPAYPLDVRTAIQGAMQVKGAQTHGLLLGEAAYSTSALYTGLKTSYMTGTQDYMIISGTTTDGNTYISAKSGSNVHMRAGGNSNGNEIVVSASTGITYKSDVRHEFSTGSVGINTASPSAKLHAHGGNVVVTSGKQLISTNTYSQAPIGMLTIQGPTNGGTTINSDVWGLVVGPQHTRSATANTYYPGIAFNHLLNHTGQSTYNSAPQAWIGTRLHDTPGSERDFLVFATKSGTGTSSSDVPLERMCIDPVYGSIGIGTTDPDSQMQIGRSQTTDAFNGAFIKLRPSNTTNSTGLTSITLGTSTVDNYGYSISGWRAGTDGSPYLRIQRHNNSATGTDVMVMNNSGNVGINTTSPAYKLDVYGGDARIGTNLRLGNGSAAGNSTNPAITVSAVNTAGVYFENSGVGFGAGSGSKYLFLSSAGNASLGGNGFFKQLGDRPYGTDNLNDYYRSNDEASFCQFYRYDATHGHWANSSGTLTTNAPSTLTQTTSQIYSYGSLLTLRSLNSFRGQFYFAHSASEFYWRSGWGTNGDQNWTRIVGDRNIQSVINNVGNISIGGVSTNTARLHINETGTGTPIQITRANNSGNGMIKFMTGGTNDWIIGLRNVNDSDFHLYSYATASNVFSVLRANGNVGIGDDTPENKLTVNGSSRFKDTMFFATTNRGLISWGTMGGGTGFGMQAASGNGLSLGANSTWDHIVITTAGNVGIGTNNPAANLYVGSGSQATSNMPGISIGNGTTTYSFFSASDQTKQFIAGVDHTITYTKAGTLSNHDHAIITNNTARIYTKADGNVGVSTTSPAATLDVKKGSSNTNNKLMKVADDVLSVYKVTGLSNHTVTLTCGSYFQAEVVITANQTNGGTYNNLYIRGIWSNNHHSHHWDEIENIGSLTGSSFSIAVSANDVSNSGKLVITHTYSSGSFSQMVVRVTDLYGSAHSYSIT